MTNTAPDLVVDARGLLCPLPLLRARRAIESLQPGGVLLLLADDPALRRDLGPWSEREGHEVLTSTWEDGTCRTLLRRAAGPC